MNEMKTKQIKYSNLDEPLKPFCIRKLILCYFDMILFRIRVFNVHIEFEVKWFEYIKRVENHGIIEL